MFYHTIKRWFVFFLVMIIASLMIPVSVYATDTNLLNGKLGVSDTANTLSASGDTFTATAKGSMLSKKSNTITFSNNSGTEAKLTVEYSVTSANSFSIAGASAATSGSYSTVLPAGSSVAFVIQSKSGFSDLTVTLNVTKVSLAPTNASFAFAYQYDSSLGKVQINGTDIANGATVNMNAGDIANAIPNSGVEFVGWVDKSNNSLISTEATCEIPVDSEKTVEAVFETATTGTAWFYVKETNQVFNSLDAAANSGNAKTVVLLNNGTLSGNHTIPAGVTFMVPFNNAFTLYTNNHAENNGGIVESGYAAATGPFRTLNMADGATITVNGVLSLPAVINSPGGGVPNAGAPTGKVPYIKMNGNSNITVNNGAYLYCTGFITGTGTVTIKSGATAYECFQLRDYRGGSGTSSLQSDGKKVFPSSQYYIQNVEVPMTFEPGGRLTGFTAVTVSVMGVKYMNSIGIVGPSGCLFTNTGMVTKQYDGSTDRLIIDINGDASVGGVKLDFGYMGYSVDSSAFVLGLNNNMTVNVNSGKLTIGQSLGMQPGSVLNVGADGEVVLNKNVYVYDSDDWGLYVYSERINGSKYAIKKANPSYQTKASVDTTNNHGAVAIEFAPGRSYIRTAADLVDAKININGTLTATNGLVYTTSGTDGRAAIVSSEGTGTVVMSAGTETVTYQADMNTSGDITYYSIPITNAALQNGDGSYTLTTDASSTTYEYCDQCLLWYTDACPGTKCKCQHIYNGYQFADNQHWQVCTECGESTTPEDCFAGEATCVALAKCSVCDNEYGELAEHTYSEDVTYTWTDYTACVATRACMVCSEETEGHTETAEATITSKDTTPATCKAPGVRTHTATFNVDWAVEQTATEEIEVDNEAHAWDNACDTDCNNGCGTTREATHDYGSVVTNPTCTVGGYTTHTCSVCGDSYTDGETAATGCSYSDKWETDVDSHWHVCSVCGEESEKVAHADGNNDHKCDTCEYVMSECSFTVKGELKTAGTCMANAVYEAKCSVCGAVSETETITGEKDSTNHTGVNHTVNAEDATCTEAGYTGDTVCECGTPVKTGETIPAKTHDYGETSYAWADDGKSCTAKRTCANDTSHVEEVTATIASEITTPATCTVMGTTTYTATFGVDWATEQTTTRQDVAVIDHTYDRQNTEDTFKKSDATCTDAALYYYSCACGAKGSETFNYGEANGHSYANAVVDFSEDGTTYTVTVTCSVCTEDKTSESLNSIVSDTIAGDCQTNKTTTYSASGEYEGVNYSDTKTVEGEKGDHSYDDGVVTPPTCENGGFTTYTCQVEGCGHSYTDNETAASGHTYGTPVFSWNGYICTAKVVCHCNAEQSVDVEVTSKVTTTATCTGEGVRTYTATAVYNGTTYTSDECPTENLGIDSTNHVNKTEHGQTAATCTEIGYTAGTYCEDCKTWISGHEEIEALEHDWTVSYSWSNDGKSCTATRACGNDAAHNETEIVTAADAVKTAATCLEKGTTTYTANFVADWAETQTRDMQDIAQLEHSYTGAIKSNGNGKDATHSFMCVNGCNEYGGAVTHTWNEGEQTKAPACEVAGVKTYTCTAEGCGATYTEEVAALVHTDADNDGDHKCDHGGCSEIISDCTDTNTDHKCDVCGAELSQCTDEDKNHKCDVCGTELSQCADGNNDHKCDVCDTELSQCADNNNDHKCDVCGTKLSECSGGTATCTQKAVCSVCGREYGDLAAHTPAAAVEENRVTSTCTVAGSYDSVVYCSVCKTHEISRETMTLELSDHTYDQKVVTEDYLNTAATCQEKATYFKSCTCGATGEETFEYGDPAGHTYGEPAYSWNDTTLTVTLTCGKCEEGTDNKILTGSAEGTVKSSTVGDCKTNATTTYEATVTLNGKAYPNETTITGELGGHSYSGGSCTICGEADPDAPAVEFAPTFGNGSGETEMETDTAESGAATYKFQAGTATTAPYVTITAPVDGWKLSEENEFTVKSDNDIACVVIVKDAEGNYTRLTAATDEGTGIHSFKATLDEGYEIIVAMKGDVNGNGRLDALDARQVVVAVTSGTDELKLLILDVNNNTRPDALDARKIAMTISGTQFSW